MDTIAPSHMKSVAFTALRRAELVDRPCDSTPLRSDEVTGRTLVSLVSPGTELNWGFDQARHEPTYPGYAAVFEIDGLGSAVRDLQIGQRVFAAGNHSARQRAARSGVVAVPDGLAAAAAVTARLMGVSWSTLTTTLARPPGRVAILGLGMIGNLAAQIFAAAGYVVTGIDPVAWRRDLAQQCGLSDVRAACPVDDPAFVGTIALAVDCSGHEQAVVDACKIVKKGGEVVLVGVPWKKRSEATAFDITHAVFHRYVHLRSGWEWEVPTLPREFAVSSLQENYVGALEWLRRGRVTVERLYDLVSPVEAQRVYDDLLVQRGGYLSAVFDWSKV